MSAAALDTMVRIQARATWKAAAVWVVGIALIVVLTTVSIDGLYDTPAKIATYAQAARAGDAMVALNGRVAGVDTLGGIVANEFGFIASFAIPFMGVALVARTTRRDEELGRFEALLAGRIGRRAPVLAAVLLAVAALAAVGAVLVSSLLLIGVPGDAGLLYGVSMVALGAVFATLAALVAQLVEHARAVYGAGLAAIVLAYLLRGIGDVSASWLVWLSPLGWQERTRAFGDQRWWPLLLPVAVAGVLLVSATLLAGRRDLGGALIRSGSSAPAASGALRRPWGLAARLHRASMLGWGCAAVVVGGAYGALTRPLLDTLEGNPSVAKAMGAGGAHGLDAVLTMNVLLIAIIGGGYVVQAVGVLRAEETSGRLESRLAGTRTRPAWLGTHLFVVAAGVVAVVGAGTLAFSVGVRWSTGSSSLVTVLGAESAELPAVALLGAVATLVFSALPRWPFASWLAYAVAAVIAYLGEPLGLPGVVLALSPYHWVGSLPRDPVDAWVEVTLLVLAAAALVLATVAFRRRGVPQG